MNCSDQVTYTWTLRFGDGQQVNNGLGTREEEWYRNCATEGHPADRFDCTSRCHLDFSLVSCRARSSLGMELFLSTPFPSLAACSCRGRCDLDGSLHTLLCVAKLMVRVTRTEAVSRGTSHHCSNPESRADIPHSDGLNEHIDTRLEPRVAYHSTELGDGCLIGRRPWLLASQFAVICIDEPLCVPVIWKSSVSSSRDLSAVFDILLR